MANPSSVTLQLPAAVNTGIATAQAVAGAGNLTLNGSLVASGVANLVTAQRVGVVSSSASDTAITALITGTNRSGAVISETVTLTGTTRVLSQRDYATVTSIAMSGATVGNISAGTYGVGSTEWVLDNIFTPAWYLSIAVAVLSGSVTYQVEHTYDDPNATNTVSGSQGPILNQYSLQPQGNVPPIAWLNASLVNKSANGETQYANQPIMAHRLTITAGTGLAMMQSVQAGRVSP